MLKMRLDASNANFDDSDAYFDASDADLDASDADTYDSDAESVLLMLIFQNGGWPCTALRAQ